jgi:tripartite-type tricarboxylate transporter receptor subunit TctC
VPHPNEETTMSERSVGAKGVLALACIAAGLLATMPTTAVASDYPSKPIRMVIPFAPGGTTDLLARAIAQHLAQVWGQPVVNENRAGANGLIAADLVAKSPGDGYTLSVVAMGHAINPLIYRKVPFDADKDFTPISLIAVFPQLVLVHPSVPATSLGELIALAKSASPPLTYASGGNGSSQHLAGALFTHMAGVNMTHVPYKGGAPALLDLVGGNVKTMIVQPTSREQITSGQLRALAVSSATRSRHYPDIPTVAEAGVPGYQSVAWYGVIGPKNMPPDVLKKVSDEVVKAIATEPVRRVIDSQGGEPVAGSPGEFGDFIAAERKRYETIVRAAAISVE